MDAFSIYLFSNVENFEKWLHIEEIVSKTFYPYSKCILNTYLDDSGETSVSKDNIKIAKLSQVTMAPTGAQHKSQGK